jgi:hypothetical protein
MRGQRQDHAVRPPEGLEVVAEAKPGERGACGPFDATILADALGRRSRWRDAGCLAEIRTPSAPTKLELRPMSRSWLPAQLIPGACLAVTTSAVRDATCDGDTLELSRG